MYKNFYGSGLLSSAGFASGDVSMVFFSCAASRMYRNARSLALRRMRWRALLLFQQRAAVLHSAGGSGAGLALLRAAAMLLCLVR